MQHTPDLPPELIDLAIRVGLSAGIVAFFTITVPILIYLWLAGRHRR